MRKTDDLMIKAGTIAELCGLIRDAKTDYNKSIDALNRDTTYKDEYKKELANRYKTSLDAKILDFQQGIKEEIEEIKASVFEPMNKEDMADIMQTIDYLSTMKSAGALSDNMISNEISKYKGNETAMLYFREKAKNEGISTSYFDNHIFSEYVTDFDGNTRYIEPTAFFDSLERVISSGNDILISHALKQTEDILGVSSTSLKNYDTAVSESHNTTIPTVI